MLLKALIPELPHDIKILPTMSRWLVRISVFRAGVVEHCLKIERLSTTERRLAITIAMLVFKPDVGVSHKI